MGDEADYLYEQAMMLDLKQFTIAKIYRKQYLNKNIWLTRNKEEIPLAQMPTQHIYNTINFLSKLNSDAFCGTADEWLAKMQNELRKRKKK